MPVLSQDVQAQVHTLQTPAVRVRGPPPLLMHPLPLQLQAETEPKDPHRHQT